MSCEEVPYAGRERWLELRRQGVGGSDVAALMGLSPWKGPVELWLEKTGRAEPEDVSGRPEVEWGTRLEHVIARAYAERHPSSRVTYPGPFLRSCERPWAQASLDGLVEDPERGVGVLEVKTGHRRRDWEGPAGELRPPLRYLCQVCHYMSVSGAEWADFAVLVDGSDYLELTVRRDEEDVAAVDAAVDAFWSHVRDGTSPAPAATDASALALLHPQPPEPVYLEADEPTRVLVMAWVSAKERAREADEYLKGVTARLEAAMGDADRVAVDAGEVRWGRGTVRRLDTERLKAERPDIYERYLVERPRNGGLRWHERKGQGWAR